MGLGGRRLSRKGCVTPHRRAISRSDQAAHSGFASSRSTERGVCQNCTMEAEQTFRGGLPTLKSGGAENSGSRSLIRPAVWDASRLADPIPRSGRLAAKFRSIIATYGCSQGRPSNNIDAACN